jgi:hypothetical protein
MKSRRAYGFMDYLGRKIENEFRKEFDKEFYQKFDEKFHKEFDKETRKEYWKSRDWRRGGEHRSDFRDIGREYGRYHARDYRRGGAMALDLRDWRNRREYSEFENEFHEMRGFVSSLTKGIVAVVATIVEFCLNMILRTPYYGSISDKKLNGKRD